MFTVPSSVSSPPRHSVEIQPFETVTTPAPPAPQSPVRFIQPGEHWQPRSNDDVVIEFDSKGMSPEQAEAIKREIAKAMREKSQ
jgi:hypothetical protein